MHDRRKAPAVLLALLLAAPALIAAEPIPRVLDQAKLDRFLADVDLLTAEPDVAAAWNSAGSAAAQKVVIDPNANFASGDTVASVYALIIRASQIAREDGPAAAALKKHDWNPEFWDIYAALLIGLHYASVAEINAAVLGAGAADSAPQEKLPPIERFIHPEDYKLVVANYQRIFAMAQHEGGQKE